VAVELLDFKLLVQVGALEAVAVVQTLQIQLMLAVLALLVKEMLVAHQ
jgi:hypothetical protein